MHSADILRAVLSTALVALSAACATFPPVQQAYAFGRDGVAAGVPLPCTGGAGATADAGTAAEPLPGPTLRLLSWNLHKNGDPGWEADLARLAADSDLLLIQEAALTGGLQRVLAPLAGCAERMLSDLTAARLNGASSIAVATPGSQ